MEQRLTLVTLGVDDLARSIAFYEGLGWTRSMRAAEGVAFFQLGGIGLALWSNADLAADCGMEVEKQPGFRGAAIAHNVRERGDVEPVIDAMVAAGATLVKPAEETPWGGYVGYVADPDGHLWEIAWNPGFPLGEDGAVAIPD